MKVVRFNDGSYGIRKWEYWGIMFVREYKDLRHYSSTWWSTSSHYFINCKGDYRTVIDRFEEMKEVKREKCELKKMKKQQARNSHGRGLRRKEYRKLKVLHKIKGNMGVIK